MISRRVTILDASALGLDLTVFVSLRASEHSEAWLEMLNSAIRDIPEVVEFYRMSGDEFVVLCPGVTQARFETMLAKARDRLASETASLKSCAATSTCNRAR